MAKPLEIDRLIARALAPAAGSSGLD